VMLEGTVVGTRVDTTSGRLLFLPAILGRTPGRPPPEDVASECRAMFDSAQVLLANEGFTFRDVARTWIFVARLLEWYDDLNAVRSAFFHEHGLLPQGPNAFLPASTGIQGRHASGAECVLDVFAVSCTEGTEPILRPIRSQRQDSAFHYGSAFSRGMRVGSNSSALQLVSGTASIGLDGRTRYVDDARGQISETYLNVAAVMHAEDAGMNDVANVIRYHKDASVFQVHREMVDLGLLPDLPAIDVLADVCRHDLLFEMEATAIR